MMTKQEKEKLAVKMKGFKEWMKSDQLSDNTVICYTYSVRSYIRRYGEFSRKNLLEYKAELMDEFKPRTVNNRIMAINKNITQ